MGSDGFEKVLIGTRGARETFLRGRKGRAAKKKEVASLNIQPIRVTLDTFQLLSGWLKERARLNIILIFVTFDTSQLLSGWLIVLQAHFPVYLVKFDSAGV